MSLELHSHVKPMKLIDMRKLAMHKQVTSGALKMKRSFILAIMPFVAISSAMAEVPHTWQTYTNGRFGYSVCYPADLLRPQTESGNGDGRMFVGPRGTKLLVWGGWNVMQQSVAQERNDRAREFTNSGYTISYQVVRHDWFVLSGSGRGKSFYQRMIVTHDREVGFSIEYPAADATLWNPVVAKLSRCLTR